MKGKFEEAMTEISRMKSAQAMIKTAKIILNVVILSGIAFFVLFVVAVGMRWI
jgi:flagellar biosynthesis protein FlhB